VQIGLIVTADSSDLITFCDEASQRELKRPRLNEMLVATSENDATTVVVQETGAEVDQAEDPTTKIDLERDEMKTPTSQEQPPIVLLLVGPSGAGKQTRSVHVV
jgi:flagellar biosynthesis GTPase FlhF